jgi:hypothetical protein
MWTMTGMGGCWLAGRFRTSLNSTLLFMNFQMDITRTDTCT